MWESPLSRPDWDTVYVTPDQSSFAKMRMQSEIRAGHVTLLETFLARRTSLLITLTTPSGHLTPLLTASLPTALVQSPVCIAREPKTEKNVKLSAAGLIA